MFYRWMFVRIKLYDIFFLIYEIIKLQYAI